MTYLAVKIPVIESEAGWGRKVDDHMVCLSNEDAFAFRDEFNSKNTSETTPDWYMQVEGDPVAVDLTEAQYTALSSSEKSRMWWSTLKNVKDD